MMELGIFAKTFRRSDAQTTLEAVRAFGLGCVQFNFECAGLPSMPEEMPSSTLAAVAAASQDTGIRLAALSGTFNMAHPERDVRKRGLLRLRVVAEAAAHLEVPLVRLLHSAGFRGPVIMHGFEENRVAESTAFARAKLARAKLKTETDHASH